MQVFTVVKLYRKSGKFHHQKYFIAGCIDKNKTDKLFLTTYRAYTNTCVVHLFHQKIFINNASDENLLRRNFNRQKFSDNFS